MKQCMAKWAQSMLGGTTQGLTISCDGKTIRCTAKMENYESPLHIISAHVAELGITLASQKVDGKSNEIPALRQLLEVLSVEGRIIVADALHCQKETAAVVVKKKADYLLSVKDNQSALKQDIEEYVQDDKLLKSMDSAQSREKNVGRLETRSAFVTGDIDWLSGKSDWKNLACIGAIQSQTEYKGKSSSEWRYYISSRKLTAGEILKHARMEWSVESMRWLLDVHFDEDFCRIEDEGIQQVLNVVRKIALNCVKAHKQKSGSRLPLSKIMFACLMDCGKLLPVLLSEQN